MSDRATQVVEAVLANLTNRRGLRQEWNAIDTTTQEDIKTELAAVVRQVLDGTTETQGYEPDQTPMSVSGDWKSDGTGFRE